MTRVLVIAMTVALVAGLATAEARPQRTPIAAKQAKAILYRTTLLERAWLHAAPRVDVCLQEQAGIPACIKPVVKPVVDHLALLHPQLLHAAENGPLRCSRPFRDLATIAKAAHRGLLTGPAIAMTDDASTIVDAAISTTRLAIRVPRLVQSCRAR